MARAHQQEQEVWVCSDDRYHHHAPLADDARRGPPTPAWPEGEHQERWQAGQRSLVE